jgi:hypothetical protein
VSAGISQISDARGSDDTASPFLYLGNSENKMFILHYTHKGKTRSEVFCLDFSDLTVIGILSPESPSLCTNTSVTWYVVRNGGCVASFYFDEHFF